MTTGADSWARITQDTVLACPFQRAGERKTKKQSNISSVENKVFQLAAHPCNPSVQEVRGEESRVQSQPQLNSGFEASQGYVRPYL